MASSYTDEDQIAVSHLFDAISTGELELLKKFAAELNCGETLAETFLRVKNSKNMTALHMAAAKGKTQICEYLIQSLKLDVNLEDGFGNTPLHHATVCQQYPTVEFLLNIGANPNYANREDCSTPLHYAAWTGCKEIIRLLIERGAEIEAKSLPLRNQDYVKSLIESGIKVDVIGILGGTPLHRAVYHIEKDSVVALLKHKANPNALADPVITPLSLAITVGSLDVMKLLLKAGADPNFESCGVTPLIVASSIIGGAEAVKLLLKVGAKPNVTNLTGLTPLEVAAMFAMEAMEAMDGHLEICKILFPVTNPVPYIRHWTLEGVLNYVNSNEAQDRLAVQMKGQLVHCKSRGEAAFKKKDYFDAIFWYNEALKAESMDAAVLSNRSLCWARVENGDQALVDAQRCITVKPDWPKAHYRTGVAYTLLKDYVKAADAFSNALKLDPHNKEIQAALRDAVAKQFSSSINIGTSIIE